MFLSFDVVVKASKIKLGEAARALLCVGRGEMCFSSSQHSAGSRDMAQPQGRQRSSKNLWEFEQGQFTLSVLGILLGKSLK